jgi:hypothetical protein
MLAWLKPGRSAADRNEVDLTTHIHISFPDIIITAFVGKGDIFPVRELFGPIELSWWGASFSRGVWYAIC